MKKRYNSITFISILTLIITLFISVEPALSKSDDVEDVENSIIIEGLQSDSGKAFGDDLDVSKGTIIYDDTFDDNIQDIDSSENADRPKRKKYPKRVHKPKKKSESLIAKLKAKDKRWHLTSHEIKEGENLWDLSKKYDTDSRLIIKINKIRNPDRLYKGKTILIPNRIGLQYKVKSGDCLIKIARRYGIDVKKIVKHNKIKHDKIRVGETLFLPDTTRREEVQNNHKPDRDYSKRSKQTKRKKLFSWPLSGRITSAFGNRINPVSKRRKFHCGVDISAPVGSPVRASRDGKVIFSGWKQGYGKVVILRHKDGYITVYAHNKKNVIKEGNWVRAGRKIALSGHTGAVTGPHLHFELRKYLTPLNPLRFLR